MLDHDRFDGREAEPGAFVELLGGEEVVEHTGLHVLRDPRAAVDHFHRHLAIGGDRPQCERPGPLHGVYRVRDEVGPHLVELAAESLDPGKIGIEVADNLDVVETPTEDEQRVLETAVDLIVGDERSALVGITSHRSHHL